MFSYVQNEKDIELLLDVVDKFHDGLLKEFECVGRGYVDNSLLMYDDLNPLDCRIVIQQQSNKSPCTELIFEEVSFFSFFSGDFLEPKIFFDKSNINFHFTFGKSLKAPKIVAKKLKYKVWGVDKLGRSPLYTEIIPFGEIREANFVKDDWVECSHCGEIWEAKRKYLTFDQCATCAAIYKLKHISGQILT